MGVRKRQCVDASVEKARRRRGAERHEKTVIDWDVALVNLQHMFDELDAKYPTAESSTGSAL